MKEKYIKMDYNVNGLTAAQIKQKTEYMKEEIAKANAIKEYEKVKNEDYYRWVAKSVQPMVVPAWVYGEDGKQDVAKYLRWSAGGSE